MSNLPERPELRIGDEVRNRVVDDLRIHFAAGRLNLTEFEERTASALVATTVSDLQPLLADLPDARPKTPTPSGPPVRQPAPSAKHDDAKFRAAVSTWLSGAILFNLIWLLTGGFGDYYWPIWPMFGTGIPVLFAVVHRVMNR